MNKSMSSQTESTLREDLQSAEDGKGDSLICVKQPFDSSVSRTQHDINAQLVSIFDAGAVGDGIHDDTNAFSVFEGWINNRDVDLFGKTYLVDSIPRKNRYFNGKWIFKSAEVSSPWQGTQMTGEGRFALGYTALSSLPVEYNTGDSGTVVAIGKNALLNATQVKNAIAIGYESQLNTIISRDNISIGDSSLKNIQALTPNYDQDKKEGTRNIAIGGNSGYFSKSSDNMLFIGRNSGQCVVSGYGITAIGSATLAGYAPIGLSGEIENWSPIDTNGENFTTAVGFAALNATTNDFSAAFGGEALKNNKKSSGNTALGPQCFRDLDLDTWYNGGEFVELNIDGSYSQEDIVITITAINHGLAVGDIALFRLLDGGSATFASDIVPQVVTSVMDMDTFTIESPNSKSASGSAILYSKATSTQQPLNSANTAMGALAGYQVRTGTQNTIGGYRALNDAINANSNVAFGFRALSGLEDATQCVALGNDALRYMVDGTLAYGKGVNRVGIGNSCRVSGDNQVQLGNSESTVYAYGAIQTRSDERDKSDIQEIPPELAVAFVRGLQGVFYRNNYRDDYFEEYSLEMGLDTNKNPTCETQLRPTSQDGSKKRKRLHAGYIAQQVRELMDSLNIDFGAHQDHSVNGGSDVQTLGYTEILPLISVTLNSVLDRLDAIEKHLAK